MRSRDKHLQELVTRLLFLPDNPVAADATLVLGMSLWQSPLKAAVRLFRGGSAGTLVFSGGYNDRIGRTEAEVMAEAAIAQGVPPDLILSGINRGANLAEDVTYSGTVSAAIGTLAPSASAA